MKRENTEGAAFFDSKGLVYDQLDARGHHGECQRHCRGPEQVYESFQTKESGNCCWRLVPFTQGPCAHCCHSDWQDGSQAPTIFTGSHPCHCLLVPRIKRERASFTDPEYLQEGVGGGCGEADFTEAPDGGISAVISGSTSPEAVARPAFKVLRRSSHPFLPQRGSQSEPNSVCESFHWIKLHFMLFKYCLNYLKQSLLDLPAIWEFACGFG